MNTAKENGAALAFPLENAGEYTSAGGLTKREHFAVLAMQGLLANPNYEWTDSVSVVADDSLRQADALLEALAERGGEMEEHAALIASAPRLQALNAELLDGLEKARLFAGIVMDGGDGNSTAFHAVISALIARAKGEQV